MIRRGGRSIAAGAAFHAWTSGSFEEKVAALDDQACHPVDRHHLLQSLVGSAYKLRVKQPEMRAFLRTYARQHLRELPALAEALRAESAARDLPVITTFAHLEMAYCEDGQPDEARKVWSIARDIGYPCQDDSEIAEKIAKRMRRLDKAKSRARVEAAVSSQPQVEPMRKREFLLLRLLRKMRHLCRI